jgi:hypothetical protein
MVKPDWAHLVLDTLSLVLLWFALLCSTELGYAWKRSAWFQSPHIGFGLFYLCLGPTHSKAWHSLTRLVLTRLCFAQFWWYMLGQGILKEEVSLYSWPPVYWFGISCMATVNFCFYLQNRLFQTSKTGGQWYIDTSPFSIPWLGPNKYSTFT